MTTHDDALSSFFDQLVRTDPILAQKMRGKAALLRDRFSVETVGELFGLLHPLAPQSPSSTMCLAGFPRYDGSRGVAEASIRGLSRALRLPTRTTRLLVDAVERVPQPLRTVAPVASEWHLGSHSRSRLRSGKDYHVIDVLDRFPTTHERGGLELLPQLEARLGPAWDQAQRGTCVAFATGGLFSYVVGKKRFMFSLQFLYHQCKMIDGILRMEGTFLEAAMRVLSDRRLSGPGAEWGTGDSGIPAEAAWRYDPSYIRNNPAQTPPPAERLQALYNDVRWGNVGGCVLRCSRRGNDLVQEMRTLLLVARLPVLIGIPLFPSFNNANSRRTGRIPMPLPHERSIGGHAMLVVGCDDPKQAFVVRNSWSPSWAPENPYGLPGHALIPYKYFTRYGSNSYSIESCQAFDARVPESARLYRKPVQRPATSNRAAVLGARRRPARRRAGRRAPVPPPQRQSWWSRLFG